ncbi:MULTISPECIES: phosphopantetheine-binding protein [unclassified Streptomyces]|uniref:phosphopantetheine-binding protein n=1 Tax=Streptomyces TaxID=1883 RepID=UPI00101E7D39|nr:MULTISPECIES: phosphopantetheine-binding protein [unclassified Streptomyces]MBZ9640169.1 phosphopantetheine-binding protein [Streptomyces sp. PSKA30]RZB14272.1 acyl carrier protein [Streptomyces sp. F001]
MTTALADPTEFRILLEEELGLHVDADDLDRPLDDFPDWDSVLLLRLVTVVESLAGRRIPVADLLQARTFRQLYEAVAGR